MVDRIKGGAYSDEQFRALSSEDKRRVQKYRDEAKKKKKVKNKERKEKRKLAKLSKADKDDGSEDERDGDVNPLIVPLLVLSLAPMEISLRRLSLD